MVAGAGSENGWGNPLPWSSSHDQPEPVWPGQSNAHQNQPQSGQQAGQQQRQTGQQGQQTARSGRQTRPAGQRSAGQQAALTVASTEKGSGCGRALFLGDPYNCISASRKTKVAGWCPKRPKASRLQAELARRILRFLQEQEARPGHHLVELDLCRIFDVSRTPVRGALKLLAAEARVTARPGRGYVLAKLPLAPAEEEPAGEDAEDAAPVRGSGQRPRQGRDGAISSPSRK